MARREREREGWNERGEVLHAFIAFERCFTHSTKESCAFFLLRDSSPMLNPFTSYQQRPGECHGKDETEIFAPIGTSRLLCVFWMSRNYNTWPIFSGDFRTKSDVLKLTSLCGSFFPYFPPPGSPCHRCEWPVWLTDPITDPDLFLTESGSGAWACCSNTTIQSHFSLRPKTWGKEMPVAKVLIRIYDA